VGRHGVAIDLGSRFARAASPEDEQLMAQICARDLHGFEVLYRKYHPRLARFLTNLVHRPPIVEEVLNDTMMVVWNKPESFRGESKLSTWIFAIAYRKALKALRRFDDPVDDTSAQTRVSEEPWPDEEVRQQQVQRLLLNALGQLSTDHRTVVDLTYFHEMGYREIAEIMGCPVATVKTRMFHARRHLKRILSGDVADWL
jgi:RNA polymerase sigma factor (sigma-70 family)